MKQINPLYLSLLLIAALLFVSVKLYRANELHKEALASLQQTEAMAKRITALKSVWDAGADSTAQLQQLLRSAPLRGTDFVTLQKRDRFTLSAEAIDRKAAEYLLNKLLNGGYVLKELEIRRLDAQRASLKAEVTL